MRDHGQRRAGNDAALWQGTLGWLEFRPSPADDHGPRMEAHLRDGQGGPDLLKPLQRAQLRRIDGVMHITGREEYGRPNTKAKPDLRKQSWLCVLKPEDAAPILERVHVGEWDHGLEDIAADSPLWSAP